MVSSLDEKQKEELYKQGLALLGDQNKEENKDCLPTLQVAGMSPSFPSPSPILVISGNNYYLCGRGGKEHESFHLPLSLGVGPSIYPSPWGLVLPSTPLPGGRSFHLPLSLGVGPSINPSPWMLTFYSLLLHPSRCGQTHQVHTN